MALEEEDLRSLRDLFARVGESMFVPAPYRTIGAHLSRDFDVLELFERIPKTLWGTEMLFGVVHYLILKGEDHPLAALYNAPEARGALDRIGVEFVDFCRDYSDEIVEIANDRLPQGNEVNRCVALLPALMEVHRQTRRPLALLDLGASAGLNLLFDRFRYDYVGGQIVGSPGSAVRLSTQLRGRVPRLDATAPPVEHRLGIDLQKLDLNHEDDELWLRACISVGDVAREQRLTAALGLARREWIDVIEGNVLEALPKALRDVPPGLEICLFSSFLMTWMSEDARGRLIKLVAELADRRDLWWVTYENAHKVPELETSLPIEEPSTALVQLRHATPRGIEVRDLATADPFCSWLNWADESSSAW